MYDYEIITEIENLHYDSDVHVLEAWYNYFQKNMLVITEANSYKTNYKSFISKIIEGIRKSFIAIKTVISNIINKIKSLFSQNKTKNVNEIAQGVIGNTNDIITESFYVEGVQKGVDYITAHGRTPEQFSNEIYLQIMNNDTIRCLYVENKQLDGPDINSSKDLKNVNKSRSMFDGMVSSVVYTIMNKEILRNLYLKMNDFITIFKKTKPGENTNELDKHVNELKKALKEFKNMKDTGESFLRSSKERATTPFEIKVTDLLEVQSLFSKITVESGDFISLDDNSYSEWYDKYIRVLNETCVLFTNFQMELNTFSNALDFDTKFIAPQYRGKIKDPVMLAKFVKGCIDKGISPKYLVYNTWLITSKKLKGNTKQFNPVKGESRFVLFPEDTKIVYKIAMSGFGISANNNEYKVTNMVKNNPEVKDYFALIIDNYENGVLVTQERVINNLHDSGLSSEVYEKSLNTLFDKSESTSDIQDDIAIIQRELGIKMPISISDLHSGNKSIDTNRGHLVLLDYGMLVSNMDLSGIYELSPEAYELQKESRRMSRDYKAGKITNDEYNKWKNEYDKKMWALRPVESMNQGTLVNKRNDLIEQARNETDPNKKHELKKKMNKIQKELHLRDSDVDSHVYGMTITDTKNKESD